MEGKKKNYYHVSSEALEKNDIFQSREDFIAAMNDIALCVLKYDVVILCFCLMSNHFHFILRGSYHECYAFMCEFKRICAIRMRDRNGEVSGLKDVDLHFDLLDTQEYLENAIAYVLRNPLAARIIMMPYFYEWSSSASYFRGPLKEYGIPVNTLSLRKRRELLRTRHPEVPDSYMLNHQGFICPSCYVAVEEVEKIFRHPSRLMVALAKKLENEFEVASGAADRIVMLDGELKTQVLELIEKEFGVSSLAQLSADDRLRLCRLMRKNFNSPVKQIARVLRLSQAVVASVL